MVKCGVTYGGGRSACEVSGWACGPWGGKCTTSGAFGGVAVAARVGRCASDETAAEDDADAVESMDIARPRSTGVSGSVATECADDVDGRRKIALEKCLPGDGVCSWVCTVRMLVGDVDAARPGGGEEESCACAASDETMSGARIPWPKDWPRISGCGRSAWSAMNDRVEDGRGRPVG
jgi:hypothetical protein